VNIGMDRCHWHIGPDGVLTIYHAGEPIIVLALAADQKIGLARDLLAAAARDVDRERAGR
jgi:hypothetical protein